MSVVVMLQGRKQSSWVYVSYADTKYQFCCWEEAKGGCFVVCDGATGKQNNDNSRQTTSY